MRRRHATHVLALLLAAVLLRLLAFEHVGVWGDYGFYMYNSRLILEGQRPFVDFLGRSPLFIYSWSAVRGLVGSPIESLRAFIIAWWLVGAAPVYGIARHLEDHRTALAALAVYLFAPFGVVYGMWANTQGLAAALGAAAIYVVMRNDDRSLAYAAAGGLFGLAYLSRRSIFVVVGAVGVYELYRVYRAGPERVTETAPAMVARTLGLTAGATVTVGLGYLASVGGDLGMAVELARIHTGDLLLSTGRGGYPLIGADPPLVTNEVDSGRIPIFNDLCQMCGAWTARTFAKTILVALPAVAVLWVYVYDLTEPGFGQREREWFYGMLALLGAFIVGVAAVGGYPLRAIAVVGVAAVVALVHRRGRIDREHLYGGHMALVLAVLLALSVGYLYRNRVLHTYYFMDFWPYLSVVAGVAYTQLVDGLDRPGRIALVAVVVVLVVTSTFAAHPLTNIVVDDNAGGWFTVNNLHDLSADLDERTQPGDVVIGTSPAYFATSHARMLGDNARLHMVAVRYKSTGPALEIYANMTAAMESGRAKYLIMSRTMRNTLRWNDSARRAYFEHYCRVVEADALYQRANAYLYRWQPECSCDQLPTMEYTNYTSPPDREADFDQVRRHERPLYSPANTSHACAS